MKSVQSAIFNIHGHRVFVPADFKMLIPTRFCSILPSLVLELKIFNLFVMKVHNFQFLLV